MDAAAQMDILREELAAVADILLAAASTGLRQLRQVRAGDLDALADVEDQLCTILSACSFQDLAGQRLSQLAALIDGRTAFGDDPLLNGPARPGSGVDQAAIDLLFQDGSENC